MTDNMEMHFMILNQPGSNPSRSKMFDCITIKEMEAQIFGLGLG